jgi:DNA-binding transcriptional regulator YhcF (GntR family)
MAQTKTKQPTKQPEDSSQVAYQGIRRMIYTRELVPGQKIAYRDLAEKLSLSPTPIIQALKRLELLGFVCHEPNRGFYMSPFSLKEIEEIYEMRELIEPSLVADAVRNIDKKGLADLKAALEAHLSAERDFYLKERLFKNREFHLTLASLFEEGDTDTHTPQPLRHPLSQVQRPPEVIAGRDGPGTSGDIRRRCPAEHGPGADGAEEPCHECEGAGVVERPQDARRTGTFRILGTRAVSNFNQRRQSSWASRRKTNTLNH